jgi:hypothetical protein
MTRLARRLRRFVAIPTLPFLRLTELAGEAAGLAFDSLSDWAGDRA